MRKALCIFLALFALIFLGFGTAHSMVNSTKDQVTWQETVLLGDRSHAAGLTVTGRNRQGSNLLWETTGVLGGDMNPKTEFTFSNSYIRWDDEYEYQGITMFPATSIHSLRLEDPDISNMAQIQFRELIDYVRECDASVAVGEEKFFTVDMTQYTDCYPLDVMFDIENCPWSYYEYFDSVWHSSIPDEIMRELNGYFRIPILGNYTIEFSINRHRPDSISMSGSADLTYAPDFFGTSTKNATYFSFTATTEDGQMADLSLLPEGYGIYRLNCRDDAESGFQVGTPLVELVYPLDPNIPYAGLDVSEDDRFLYLHRWMGEDYVRTIIELETMKEVQTLTLASRTPEGNFELKTYDGFTLVLQYGTEEPAALCLFEENADGSFTEKFTVPANAPDSQVYLNMDFWNLTQDNVAYDGTRLAIVQNSHVTDERYSYRYYDTCNFQAVVYDQTGLVFAGEYAVSLANINLESSGQESPCSPFYQCPIQISW